MTRPVTCRWHHQLGNPLLRSPSSGHEHAACRPWSEHNDHGGCISCAGKSWRSRKRETGKSISIISASRNWIEISFVWLLPRCVLFFLNNAWLCKEDASIWGQLHSRQNKERTRIFCDRSHDGVDEGLRWVCWGSQVWLQLGHMQWFFPFCQRFTSLPLSSSVPFPVPFPLSFLSIFRLSSLRTNRNCTRYRPMVVGFGRCSPSWKNPLQPRNSWVTGTAVWSCDIVQYGLSSDINTTREIHVSRRRTIRSHDITWSNSVPEHHEFRGCNILFYGQGSNKCSEVIFSSRETGLDREKLSHLLHWENLLNVGRPCTYYAAESLSWYWWACWKDSCTDGCSHSDIMASLSGGSTLPLSSTGSMHAKIVVRDSCWAEKLSSQQALVPGQPSLGNLGICLGYLVWGSQ